MYYLYNRHKHKIVTLHLSTHVVQTVLSLMHKEVKMLPMKNSRQELYEFLQEEIFIDAYNKILKINKTQDNNIVNYIQSMKKSDIKTFYMGVILLSEKACT